MFASLVTGKADFVGSHVAAHLIGMDIASSSSTICQAATRPMSPPVQCSAKARVRRGIVDSLFAEWRFDYVSPHLARPALPKGSAAPSGATTTPAT